MDIDLDDILDDGQGADNKTQLIPQQKTVQSYSKPKKQASDSDDDWDAPVKSTKLVSNQTKQNANSNPLDDWGVQEESKVGVNNDWGDSPLKVKKQQSDEPDLSYLNQIKRQPTIKNE